MLVLNGETPVAIERLLRTRFPGYQLDLDAASLDVLEFETLAAQARRLCGDHPDRATATATRALALSTGPAFTGVALGPWARTPTATLTKTVSRCCSTR
jgi:hypothetical protein